MYNNNQPQLPVQSAQIQITNINPKTIAPKPGQNFQAFTVYEIFGNDGLKYETADQNWVNQHNIGDMVNIQFTTKSGSGYQGKIWSQRTIVTDRGASAPAYGAQPRPQVQPVQQDHTMALLLQGMTRLAEMIKDSEQNILDRIDMSFPDTSFVHPGQPTSTAQPGGFQLSPQATRPLPDLKDWGMPASPDLGLPTVQVEEEVQTGDEPETLPKLPF